MLITEDMPIGIINRDSQSFILHQVRYLQIIFFGCLPEVVFMHRLLMCRVEVQ